MLNYAKQFALPAAKKLTNDASCFAVVPVPLENIPASHWWHVAELVAAVGTKRL
jgi:hypothetical protein